MGMIEPNRAFYLICFRELRPASMADPGSIIAWARKWMRWMDKTHQRWKTWGKITYRVQDLVHQQHDHVTTGAFKTKCLVYTFLGFFVAQRGISFWSIGNSETTQRRPLRWLPWSAPQAARVWNLTFRGVSGLDDLKATTSQEKPFGESYL